MEPIGIGDQVRGNPFAPYHGMIGTVLSFADSSETYIELQISYDPENIQLSQPIIFVLTDWFSRYQP